MLVNSSITINKFIYFVLFLSICVIYAFSNIRSLSMAMQLIFTITMLLHILKTNRFKLSIHFIWMLSFIAWGLFITLFAYDAVASASDIVNLTLKLISYTMLIAFIDNEHKFHFVLKSIAFAGLILCLRVFVFSPMDTWGMARLGKNFNLNPNALGMSLAYAAISSVYLGKKLNKKWYYFFAIPLIIIGLLTGSRKAFLMIAGGISLLLFLYRKKIRDKILFIALIALFLWGLYEVVMNIPMFYEVLGKRLEGIGFLSGYFDASTRTRLMMVEESWFLFKQRPILGYGLENFRLVSSFDTYAHNNYMELLCATGLIGTIIYYSLPFGLLISSIVKRKNGNKNYNIIIALLTIILIIDLALVSYKQLLTQFIIAACTAYYGLIKSRELQSKDKTS